MPQLAQTYSSTYEGLENYGAGQDFIAESWTITDVGVVTQYTKHDAIAVTTDLGSEQSLNAMVQVPMSLASLDVWNPDMVEFIGSAMAEGDSEPCKNAARIAEFAAASKPIDKICDVLLANGKWINFCGEIFPALHFSLLMLFVTPIDLSDYLNSITYSFELCHSPDDEVIVRAFSGKMA